MMFRKRRRVGGIPRQGGATAPGAQGNPELYRIDFDMMLKGALIKRRRETVRQYGVTVAGSTRLVTSGDVVDRGTYRALLAAGAIRPLASEGVGESGGPSKPEPPSSGPASS